MTQSSLRTMHGKLATYAATGLVAFFTLSGIAAAQTNKSLNIVVGGSATSNQIVTGGASNSISTSQIGGTGQNNQQLTNNAVARTRIRAASFNGVFNIINISQ